MIEVKNCLRKYLSRVCCRASEFGTHAYDRAMESRGGPLASVLRRWLRDLDATSPRRASRLLCTVIGSKVRRSLLLLGSSRVGASICGLTYTTGQKFGIANLKQTLCSESTRNVLAKRSLRSIRAQFLYASNGHRTVTVANVVGWLDEPLSLFTDFS